MPLLKARIISPDERHCPEVASRPDDDGPQIVSLIRFQQERRERIERNQAVGVKLTADDALEALVNDLSNLTLIVLEFSSFTDGRHYSNARLLRERYDYTGDLRASGEVFLDQLPFMQQCGFSSFERPGGGGPNVSTEFSPFEPYSARLLQVAAAITE